MKKIKVLQRILDCGVVAVLRGDSPEQVVEMAEQAIAGGVKIIEITMTVPNALQAIERLSRIYNPEAPMDSERFAVIGAGTVLEPHTARMAIMSGAQFVVSPALNEDTIKLCNLYRIPVMPGVVTISDLLKGLELGADVMKLFPGNMFEPSIIKTFKGPVPQANLMPTGGVSVDNLGDWIAGGAVAVGIGSDLTSEALKTGDMSKIRDKAAQYTEAYRRAKGY
ncbi:bifunctional 2-keto-4-hydroxyglutarate aldolase/2-keto-3-deoxy-6-phosphogluconate aldolase [Saccharibacillus alkalitolerans]|uniref:Bifunctional 4-hydroxy-2-oxoglutarate aldolase/2-dehydro-3-deoxy-phosphogluconate aldolase n=1 Tax=Saccharibacillus alkalitolerans TaxID=2705290 RepID=A0ABX0F1I3_9BACL|nr:bifunctional 2-keto-4-hydroxyglutarate aldolase/2-keto-3-deoxy-6-phosphogluconate aldolase [Saccharibacillus alkalitolerans]NGZ73725.1 bifunctional 4-hydroxy-2-oxoglutarate aldolase/2-dehydro-3-deoxy-phosphogluconate aldolase [Saccharibacillus alkalitolerans]